MRVLHLLHLSFLEVPGSNALLPLLDILTALCRDLRWAIYPHYPAILRCLVNLIDESDPDLMEGVFHTIGYVFKYLQRELLRDMDVLFTHYVPLLMHKKEFVRSFAAESYSYLLRRLDSQDLIRNIQSLVNPVKLLHLLNSSHSTSSLSSDSDPIIEADSSIMGVIDGLSSLLFSVMKGVTGLYHSKMPVVFRTILESFSTTPSNRQGGADFSTRVLLKVLTELMDFGNETSVKGVWEEIMSEWGRYLALFASHPKSTSLADMTTYRRFSAFLQILCTLLRKKKTIFSEMLLILKNTWSSINWKELLLREDNMVDEFYVSVMEMTSTLFRKGITKESSKSMIQEIFKQIFSVASLLHSDLNFRSFSRFVICVSETESLLGLFIDPFLLFLKSLPTSDQRFSDFHK
jgi:hypothetical protein